MIVALQADQSDLSKGVSNLEDRCDQIAGGLLRAEAVVSDVQTRQKTIVEMEAQVVMSREELRKEAADRRAEGDRLSAMQAAVADRVERAEQQRIKSESELRQEVLDGKASLKKEVRDRELSIAKVVTL